MLLPPWLMPLEMISAPSVNMHRLTYRNGGRDQKYPAIRVLVEDGTCLLDQDEMRHHVGCPALAPRVSMGM